MGPTARKPQRELHHHPILVRRPLVRCAPLFRRGLRSGKFDGPDPARRHLHGAASIQLFRVCDARGHIKLRVWFLVLRERLCGCQRVKRVASSPLWRPGNRLQRNEFRQRVCARLLKRRGAPFLLALAFPRGVDYRCECLQHCPWLHLAEQQRYAQPNAHGYALGH